MDKKGKNQWYRNIERYAIIGIFSVLLVLMMIQVVLRYVFSTALGWAEQISRLMFVLITFAGISYAAKTGDHLRVGALAELVKNKKFSTTVLLIGDTICAVFVAFLAVMLFSLAGSVYTKGQVFAAAPWCPVWIMYGGAALGMSGMAIRTVINGIWPRIQKLMGKIPYDDPVDPDGEEKVPIG